MESLRDIRKERAELEAQRKDWQQILDRAEREQRQAELTLAYLDEREEHVIQAIRHWAKERKASLRQRAAKVEMGERRKQAKKTTAPTRPSVSPAPATTPSPDTATARLNLSQLAREVEERARANGHAK